MNNFCNVEPIFVEFRAMYEDLHVTDIDKRKKKNRVRGKVMKNGRAKRKKMKIFAIT